MGVGPQRQRGMALVIVLMLFAIITVITMEVLVRQDRFLTRADNLLQWDKRYQYAVAAEVVATQGLNLDLIQDRENNRMVDDCVEEQWAIRLPPTPYEDAVLSASVQDLQGRFNLNWLVTSGGEGFVRDDLRVEQLTRLLANTLPDPNKASRIANEMTDWIDSNSIVDGLEGAEDADYRFRRVPNMPVAHETELRAVLSFAIEDVFPDPLIWGLFTALPLNTRLNVNTAPRLVLDAVVGPFAGNAGVDAIVALREEQGITDIAALLQQAPFSELQADARSRLSDLLGVSSEYFQVMVDVGVNQQQSRLVSRIVRRQAQGAGGTMVFSRQVKPMLTPLEPACNPFFLEE